MAAGEYQFRRMTADDFPLARRWLKTPAVRQWWIDPEGEVSLSEEDLKDPNVAIWIVLHRGRPFAYMQDYDPHAWEGHHFAHLPPKSRGIDQFIGEADMLDHGHGSAFVRARVEQMLAAGAPMIGTDPHPDNARAIRAYEKAGFRRTDVVETSEGPSLLMVRGA